MSYILEYADAIFSGEILANDFIKRQYEILANRAVQPDRFHLDLDIANRHIDFMEMFCRQSQGDKGASLQLELFQKAKFEAAYGMVDDDNLRQYREVNCFEGRKNGKTTEAAAIALDALINDDEGAPEVYFIATKLDQAKKGYTESRNMVQQSPALRKHIKPRGFDLYCRGNFGIIKPLATDIKKLDSYNASCVIVDELGALTSRRPYDDMKQSQSSMARKQPMLWAISTNNFVRQGIFDAQVEYGKKILRGDAKDDRFLFLYYALENESQWTNPKYWIMANPGLGTIKSKEFLEDSVNKAKNDPGYKATVLTKDFNIAQESNQSAWLTPKLAQNEEVADIKYLENSYAIGGCDLSATTDLTCASLIICKKDDPKKYLLQQYFLPQQRLDYVMSQEEPEAPYALWAEQGWLTVSPGTQVDYSQVSLWFYKMVKEHNIRPLWIGYDRALAGYWADEMINNYGFELEKIAQGAYTWTYPMKQLRAEFEAQNIVYQNNPMFLYCLLNTGVKTRNSDNIESIMPVKLQNNRRIDGTVSALNAYTCLKNHEDEFMRYVARKG